MFSLNLDLYLKTLKGGNCLSERDLRLVCEKAKEILIEESNIQPVSAPVNVCGDLHGQFYDLLKLFETGGEVPSKNYIFIGDFVDRGYNSVETFEYLLCLKLKYPSNITLLRGNHESRQITLQYGFYDEVVRKYGNANPWKYCTDVFDYLGIGAVIEGKILCIHGGLSPNADASTLDSMRLIERNMEIPHSGPFTDIMWSDPDDIEGFKVNPRGAGWLFGGNIVKQFNYINGLELICRAHQLVMDGYKFWFPERSLVTVWSAPNYCYRSGNVASILNINENLEKEFKIFDAAVESEKSIRPRNVLPYFL
mgnify:FL=1